MHTDVLIIGGGHAGAQTAIGLRNTPAFGGSVTIVTDESDLPYERPPLSKDYLAGVKPFERLLLRPPAFWSERDVRILTGQHVVQIDPAGKQARTADGSTLEYGSLVWAAGGRPRQLSLPGATLHGVHYVRARADMDLMKAELPDVQHVVVIGGGYIGLEAASVLSKLGKSVTLLEMLPRILSRVAGQEIAEFIAHEHRRHGVDVRTEVAVERIEGSGGRVTGVRLANGEHLSAQLVIAGIGIIPNIEPLEAAGAVCGNGVHVDEYCRTSLADVFAIGDCAAHHNPFAGGERIRLESVQNANEQAATAVKAIGGRPAPYASVPWFWSDQYDLKLQMAGLSLGHDTAIVRGEPSSRSFSIAYLKAGRFVALDCVNATRDYVQARKLIADRAFLDPASIANPAIALKDIPPLSQPQ